MRKTAALLSFLVAFGVLAQATSPQALLDRGMAAYRAGDYTAAVTDLQAAAQGFLTPEKMQTYVNTGTFDQLDRFETSLVYLALAQHRLGRDDDARATVLRLMSAERISPTYARLKIADAAEFDALAATLVPGAAPQDESAPLPSVQPVPAQADRQRLIDEMVALERIAAAEAAAMQRIAAAEAESRQRIAAMEAEAKQRIAAMEADAAARIAAAQASEQRAHLASLRQAVALATGGDLAGANAIYAGIANSENVPREILAEAAVGLYRTGSFKSAASAFGRMGAFAKGEEDLRYYYAVALYETGQYKEAQKELACALPFIQVTDEVTRYRVKIETQRIASAQ